MSLERCCVVRKSSLALFMRSCVRYSVKVMPISCEKMVQKWLLDMHTWRETSLRVTPLFWYSWAR